MNTYNQLGMSTAFTVPEPQFALWCKIDDSLRVTSNKPFPAPTFFRIFVSFPPIENLVYNYFSAFDDTFYPVSGTPYTFSNADIRVGDWIGLANGRGVAYMIVDIVESGQYIVADIDGWCMSFFQEGKIDNYDACIFRVNEDSIPMFGSPSAAYFLRTVLPSLYGYNPIQWVQDMVGRFALRNSKSQYVTVYQPLGKGGPQSKDFVLGESIYIDSSGVFQRSAGSLNISDTVGIVTSKGIPSDDWFSFRPSGKYFDTSVVPNDFFPTSANVVGGVTLTPGKKLYINPIANDTIKYTTVNPGSNAFATWIMLGPETTPPSDSTRAIYIAGSGGGGGGGTTAVQVFDGGDPTWVSAPPTTIYPVLDCGGI
jgi:hypothetical protein